MRLTAMSSCGVLGLSVGIVRFLKAAHSIIRIRTSNYLVQRTMLRCYDAAIRGIEHGTLHVLGSLEGTIRRDPIDQCASADVNGLVDIAPFDEPSN